MMNNIMGQGLLKSSLCKVEFKVRLQFHVKVKDAQLVRPSKYLLEETSQFQKPPGHFYKLWMDFFFS